MANVTITGLTPAAALTGTEVLAIDQTGSTVKTTVQDIANLAGGGGGATLDVVTVGTLGDSPFAVSFQSTAYLNPQPGTQSAPIFYVPQFNLSGGGMGSSFSGTLSSISFPNTEYLNLNIQGISTLTNISAPLVTTISSTGMFASLNITNNSALTTLDIPSIVNIQNGIGMFWNSNAFSEATVDHILSVFAATTSTNCTIDLSGGASAAPSATGLAAKATLEGRGWNVFVN